MSGETKIARAGIASRIVNSLSLHLLSGESNDKSNLTFHKAPRPSIGVF